MDTVTYLSEHPNTSKEPLDLQTALGRLVMCWAPLEAKLDGVCIVIFNQFDCGTIENEAPRSFSKKLLYAKKCLNKLETLSPLSVPAQALFDETQRLSETRNFLIHGFNLEQNPALDGAQANSQNSGTDRRSTNLLTSNSRHEKYELSNKCLYISDLMGTLGQNLLVLGNIVTTKANLA